MTDWGSVADWVSAGATAAALLAAAYAARVAYRQLQVLRAQEDDRRAADDIRDASRVAVWVRIHRESGLPELRYINASGMPVYALTIWVVTPDHRFEITYVVDGPTDGSKTMVRGTSDLQCQVAALGYAPDWTGLLEAGQLLCAATFRDSVNRRWYRDLRGRLHPAAESEQVLDRLLDDAADLLPR